MSMSGRPEMRSSSSLSSNSDSLKTRSSKAQSVNQVRIDVCESVRQGQLWGDDLMQALTNVKPEHFPMLHGFQLCQQKHTRPLRKCSICCFTELVLGKSQQGVPFHYRQPKAEALCVLSFRIRYTKRCSAAMKTPLKLLEYACPARNSRSLQHVE